MSALTMLGLAVMGAVLYTLFQKSAPAFGLFISMGTVVLVLWKISAAAQTVLSGLTKLEQRAGGDAFLSAAVYGRHPAGRLRPLALRGGGG